MPSCRINLYVNSGIYKFTKNSAKCIVRIAWVWEKLASPAKSLFSGFYDGLKLIMCNMYAWILTVY